MLLKAVKNSILSIGKSISEPIFIKDFDENNLLIDELEKTKERITDEETIKGIDRDLAFVRTGVIGEKNVYYELKNSFLPIVCLHDLHIKHGEYEAQIDFLIITSKFICILETKKLNGDILVNNSGDFIRQIKSYKGKKIKKEGIYSPITQNERHIKIVKDLLLKNNMIVKCPIISRVVIANPKSIVSTRYAPSNVKKQLIKHDQISTNLTKLLKDTDIVDLPYQTIMDIAQFLKDSHVEKENHYILTKYDEVVTQKQCLGNDVVREEVINEVVIDKVDNNKVNKKTNNKNQLIDELKAFRLKISREEKKPPYFIFNNNQMEDLIEKMPRTKKELCTVSGFGNVKSEKYGDDIISIVIKYAI